jgi:hypothetical protein
MRYSSGETGFSESSCGPATDPRSRSFFSDNANALSEWLYCAAAAFDSGLANLEVSSGVLSSTLVT